jgi:hypothetical protein
MSTMDDSARIAARIAGTSYEGCNEVLEQDIRAALDARDARIRELEAVAELLLLFYKAPYWGEAERTRWEYLSGGAEATTVTLAACARKALAATTP